MFFAGLACTSTFLDVEIDANITKARPHKSYICKGEKRPDQGSARVLCEATYMLLSGRHRASLQSASTLVAALLAACTPKRVKNCTLI